jgi:hypothetical protein
MHERAQHVQITDWILRKWTCDLGPGTKLSISLTESEPEEQDYREMGLLKY